MRSYARSQTPPAPARPPPLPPPPPADAVTLYYRQGASDKVYQAALQPRGGGYVVNFAFGRRGGTLQAGTKTPEPVGYAEARRVYDRLVREKTARGYRPGPDGPAYVPPKPPPGRMDVAAALPQLLNPVDEADAEKLLADDGWWAQPKYDGRRVLVHKKGPAVVGTGRNGQLVGLPKVVVEAVQGLEAASCLLDGEVVGDAYHCFDLLERDGRDLRPAPYSIRHAGVVDLVDNCPSDHLRFAETATTTRAKRALVARLRREDAEGVVFKYHASPYAPGRPASGGSQLKLKFYATASCLVAGANAGRRSVALELYAAGRGVGRVGVGSVTIPPNHAVPSRGDIVEVRYLHAYPGGSLYQPVYLGRRDDVAPDACDLAQLKYKPAAGGGDGEEG
jgi:bifunctional non-homologous end joining protein LigD